MRGLNFTLGSAALALANLAFAAKIPTGQGQDQHLDIVGGVTVPSAAKYPFVTLLEKEGRTACGGTIISPTKVLTAAQCVHLQNPGNFLIRAGSLISFEGGVARRGLSIDVHPLFDSNRLDYDVAIVTVAIPFPFGPTISAAKIAKAGTPAPAPGKGVLVIGWGANGEYGSVARQLRETVVIGVDQHTCSVAYYSRNIITAREFCAATEARGPCGGDQGGPVVAPRTFEVIGSVSWGDGCGDGDYPGVFAKYGDVDINNWIQSHR